MYRPLIVIAALSLAGCAALPDRAAFDPQAETCLAEYARLEAEIADAGTRDAGATRLPGLPWLRVNRFLASFRDELTSDARWRDWLAHLQATDLRARRFELANARDAAPFGAPLASELAALALCARRLNETVLASEALRGHVREAARVPDDYRTWQRWLGLYPLTRLFVLAGVHRLHREQARALAAPPASASDALWRQYHARESGVGNEGDSAAVPAGTAAARRGRAQPAARKPAGHTRDDALGIPRLDAPARERLLQRHAPVWRIETAGEADRIGRARWRERRHPEIDPAEPVEYRFISHTRFGGEILLQLNYLVWYPERAPQGRFDLYAGHIDGTLWRLTLDVDGTPLAGESVHACGCYYMLFPGPGVASRDVSPGGEPVFTGAPLPATGPSRRLRLTHAASDHFLVHLDTVAARTAATGTIRIPSAPADTLRSLPHPDGRQSLYRPGDGIVPGTHRPERFVLWPMGVPSAGAMRQPGRHAIAFVGRRHFDAPRLLERQLRRR